MTPHFRSIPWLACLMAGWLLAAGVCAPKPERPAARTAPVKRIDPPPHTEPERITTIGDMGQRLTFCRKDYPEAQP